MALLKPLIRAIDNLSVSFKARIPLSELVTYNFYLGKKAMFDSDLQTGMFLHLTSLPRYISALF